MRNQAFEEYIRSARLQRNIALGEFIGNLALASARATMRLLGLLTRRAQRHEPAVRNRHPAQI